MGSGRLMYECGLPVPASSPALTAMDHTTFVDKLQGLLREENLRMNFCEGNDNDCLYH